MRPSFERGRWAAGSVIEVMWVVSWAVPGTGGEPKHPTRACRRASAPGRRGDRVCGVLRGRLAGEQQRRLVVDLTADLGREVLVEIQLDERGVIEPGED